MDPGVELQRHAQGPAECLEQGLRHVVGVAAAKAVQIVITSYSIHYTKLYEVPSPKVRTYDLQPEMSAPELTDQLVAAIRSGKYDLVICNYANTDMVGHTGKLDAAMQAVI